MQDDNMEKFTDLLHNAVYNKIRLLFCFFCFFNYNYCEKIPCNMLVFEKIFQLQCVFLVMVCKCKLFSVVKGYHNKFLIAISVDK